MCTTTAPYRVEVPFNISVPQEGTAKRLEYREENGLQCSTVCDAVTLFVCYVFLFLFLLIECHG